MSALHTVNQSTRDHWLESTLRKIAPGSRILDAGAGELQYREYCTHLDYVSQDFAQYDGAGDGSALQMGEWDQSQLDIISDITSIPEPDDSFDAIMCIEVLEHLPDPIAAIKEFSRLLKPSGKLILTAPFCSLTHFSPYHYSTGFNRYFYEKHLNEYGFKIIQIERNGNYFEYIGQELYRIRTISDKYCTDSPRKYELFAIKILLKMLHRLSIRDSGSNELLCFGYHVLACKGS